MNAWTASTGTTTDKASTSPTPVPREFERAWTQGLVQPPPSNGIPREEAADTAQTRPARW